MTRRLADLSGGGSNQLQIQETGPPILPEESKPISNPDDSDPNSPVSTLYIHAQTKFNVRTKLTLWLTNWRKTPNQEKVLSRGENRRQSGMLSPNRSRGQSRKRNGNPRRSRNQKRRPCQNRVQIPDRLQDHGSESGTHVSNSHISQTKYYYVK